MSTEGKACPIISAFSELKQFSEYPKCTSDCAWFVTADWDRSPAEDNCTLVRFTNELSRLRAAIEAAGTVQQLISAVTAITGEKGVPIPSLPYQIEQLLEAVVAHHQQQAAATKKPPRGPKYYGRRPSRPP